MLASTEDFRKTGPGYQQITQINLPKENEFSLSNGIKVYEMNGGDQEVLRFIIVFESGRTFELDKLATRITAALMKEGVKGKNSEEIAEYLDFYGASVKVSAGMDFGKLIFYCLTKHLEAILPVISQILLQPIFPEEEFQNLVNNSKQRLQLDLSKNEILGYRILTEKLFGENHPYGYNSNAALYEDFDYDLIKKQYENSYWTENTRIFISGKISTRIRQLIDQTFGAVKLKPVAGSKYEPRVELKSRLRIVFNPRSE